ncbi:MAG: lantibiotic dehydratase [Salibacteraceae bacterium]
MTSTQPKGEFILRGFCRTPLFPASQIEDLSREALREFASNEMVLESILLASASFYQDVKKWLAGQLTDKKKLERIEPVLYKYMMRMSTRCTPFGLLSTSSYLDLQPTEEAQTTVIPDAFTAHTRLDTCVVQLLISKLENDPKLLPYLRFRTNTSIYDLGDQLRYFESEITKGQLKFELSKVTNNEAIQHILGVFRNAPVTVAEGAAICGFEDFSLEEVEAFIFELVQANLLISELAINVGESDPAGALLQTLENTTQASGNEALQQHPVLTALREIQQTLTAPSAEVLPKFNASKQLLKAIDIAAKPGDLLHVDAYKKLSSGPVTLKKELLDQLHTCRDMLLKLGLPMQDRFSDFKKDFERRYGERAMPLMQVLDPELGIGYTQKGEQGDSSFLLKEVAFGAPPAGQSELQLSQIELLLLKKLQAAAASNRSEIELHPKELSQLRDLPAPTTQSAIISILGEGHQLILEEFSGTSALNFLSRFTYLDSQLENLAKDIQAAENDASGGLIAELQHLPEVKSGNIILAKPVREHTIPIVVNTATEAQSAQTIFLSDILVKVENGRKIKLIAKNSGQEIVPQLGNTLNYNRDGIDIFRFLADLQLQEETPVLQFDWYRLKGLFNKFPRVCYRDIVLAPAFWIVESETLPENSTAEAIKNWRAAHGVPDKVYLCSDDRDDFRLLIDFTSSLAQEVFLQELTKNKKVFLVEALHLETDFFQSDSRKGAYLNEVILPFLKHSPVQEKKPLLAKPESNTSVQRAFLPGSEWMYFKVYTGHFTVNEIVAHHGYQLAQDLLEAGAIQKWFFIRYFDQDYHLRIRFQATSPEHQTFITQKVMEVLQPLMDQDIVHDVSMNTYERELDRYSAATIAESETLFFHDSVAVCHYLNMGLPYEEEWIFAAAGVNGLLEDFGCSDAQKQQVMGMVGDAFFQEFSITKKEKLILDKKYRVCRNVLLQELNGEAERDNETSAAIHSIIAQRSEDSKAAVQSILKAHSWEQSTDILLSHIHMFLNRLFRANPRQQELVLYYTLFKHYQSALAIKAKR